MLIICARFLILTVVLCWLQLPVDAIPAEPQNSRREKADFAYPDDLDIRKIPKEDLMFHHHHHHNPDFHHHHHHHTELFHNYQPVEDREDDSVERNEFNNATMQIPLDYIQDLNQYNVSDLLLHYVEGQEDEEVSFIQSRFGDDEQKERNSATLPKSADCMPELTTIKIASSDDPSVLFIPQCTRVERCGGCCKHDLLSCQPVKSESIPFKVYKTQYTGEKKLKFLGTDVIQVERHHKCKCLCKVKKEDCTKFQEFRESECRCACKNHDEKKKCLKNGGIKLWNPELCVCQCRDNIMCSTGSYFDQNECRCLPVPVNRRFANYQRRYYRFDPLPVVPLDGSY